MLDEARVYTLWKVQVTDSRSKVMSLKYVSSGKTYRAEEGPVLPVGAGESIGTLATLVTDSPYAIVTDGEGLYAYDLEDENRLVYQV